MTDASLALSLISVRSPSAQAGSARARSRGGRAPLLASAYAMRTPVRSEAARHTHYSRRLDY